MERQERRQRGHNEGVTKGADKEGEMKGKRQRG
jgi:hypothetical protein